MPSDRIGDLIASVTRRLRPDAELQMDVANELRAHLEDTARAAREEGLDEDAAQETALKSFGDADALENAIFHANLRRMRVRSVIRWAGRLTLMPAAALLAVWLWFGVTATFWGFVRLDDLAEVMPPPPVNAAERAMWRVVHMLGRRPELPRRPDLTPEQEALAAALNAEDTVAAAHRLVATFPNAPVYRAYLVRRHLDHMLRHCAADGVFSAEQVSQTLALLDDAERVDPTNAFWNYLKAAILLNHSGAASMVEDPDHHVRQLNYEGEWTSIAVRRLVVADAAGSDAGIAEYRVGLQKAHCRTYVHELDERRIALRPPIRSFSDLIASLEAVNTEPLTGVRMLIPVQRTVFAYARLLVEEGRVDDARRLARTAPVPGTQLGKEAQQTMVLLVAKGARAIALSEATDLYCRMGETVSAQAARSSAEANRAEMRRWTVDQFDDPYRERVLRDFGVLNRLWMPGLGIKNTGMVSAIRETEHFVLERVTLAVISTLLSAGVLFGGAVTAWRIWRHRRDRRGPRLVLPRPMHAAGVLCGAVIGPLLLYLAFTRNPWFGSLRYGINYAAVRVGVELGATAVLILVLLPWLSARAVRAASAGRPDRATLTRSVLPLLVAGLVLLCLVAQTYLTLAERHALAAINEIGERPFIDELDMSPLHNYRDWLRALPYQGALAPPTEGGADAE